MSCQQNKFEPIPTEEFTQILIDLHLSDASFAILNGNGLNQFVDSGFYDTLFIKHNYSREYIDSSISYYTQQPEHFKAIYDNVIDHLQEMKAALDRLDFEESDYKNLWNLKKEWKFPEDGKQGKITFELPIKKTGTYVIRAEIKVLENDNTVNPTFHASFNDGEKLTMPFPMVKIQASKGFKLYEISKEITDTTYHILKGVIYDHTPQGIDWQKKAEIKNIRLFCIP